MSLKKCVKGFTLVELIVVIVILAILGLISFISLQGYNKESRDVKRLSDIKNILTKINIELNKGTNLGDLLDFEKTNNIVIDKNPKTSEQGTVNFIVLKENQKAFQDPLNNKDYPFGYAIGKDSNGIDYIFIQLATVSEVNQNTTLHGNYYKLDVGDSYSILTNDLGEELKNNDLPLAYDVGIINQASCIGSLIVGNAFTYNTNVKTNTQYQNTDQNGKCYYKCRDGWTGINCSEIIKCRDVVRENGIFTDNNPSYENVEWQTEDESKACYVKCNDKYIWQNNTCEYLYSGSVPNASLTGPITTFSSCSGNDIVIDFGDGTGYLMNPCNPKGGGTYKVEDYAPNNPEFGDQYTWSQAKALCPGTQGSSVRRLPTMAEWQKIFSYNKIFNGKYTNTGIASPFNIPLAGRDGGDYAKTYGYLWGDGKLVNVNIHKEFVEVQEYSPNLTRSYSLRCIRDY